MAEVKYLTPFIQGWQQPESRISENHLGFTLKTAANNSTPQARGTSSQWVKPFLEANLRHTVNAHR